MNELVEFMIRISDTAQIYLAKLLANQKKGTQIRIFMINPGTINAESSISYCLPDDIKATDIALEFERLIIYIDRLSAPYFEDTEIDLIVNKLDSQLIMKTPNAKIRIDNNAPLVKRVEYMLQSQINSQLVNHGGFVSLIDINKEGYAMLQFSGSCQGCPMIKATIKERIEKQLLNEFPELKGIYDLTDHYA